MNSTVAIAAGIAGAAAGAVGAYLLLNNTPVSNGYPTFRPDIKSAADEALDECKPFPFNANSHPTQMFQIKLPGIPFDIRNIKPEITVMDVNASPWTDGDPSTSKPYTGKTTWSPSTPLDLDLGLVSAPGGGKNSEILIKIIVADSEVKMISDPYTIVSGDANKKMFCRFPGGFPVASSVGIQNNSATFATSYYYKPNGNNKTMSSYNIGLNIPATDKSYILPIYLDPEVENNGFN